MINLYQLKTINEQLQNVLLLVVDRTNATHVTLK